MNVFSLAGAFTITLSLLSYGIGSISIQRFRTVSVFTIVFLAIGLVLDIVATVLMIIGSHNLPFTLHGWIGYSAFFVMLVYVIIILRFYLKHGSEKHIDPGMVLLTKISYGWWVVAYLTGSIIILGK